MSGDFNQITNINLDCEGKSLKSYNQSKLARDVLDSFTKDCAYEDVFRTMNTASKQYTFCGISNYRARLDKIYAHSTLMSSITKCGITACTFSDHDMFWIEIGWTPTRQRWGNGLWKYNEEILKAPENQRSLERDWVEHCHNKGNFISQLDFWEAGKDILRSRCQEFGRK